ncbi:GMC family oxidoreductase [Mesorhizobium sp. M1A.F.Ca.IN.020.06.1.1]|uniref:GMC oxidoreductase n=1 Tax=unclassified Mesorhizobium TaxID=325217 RepID=UPI000BAEB081|nr:MULTISPECIES: GMC family oxidoreductase [unclassified Mesorhizobium]PBB28912.1 GMC family oxidoreductase [Mesorhizobium sp. WSM3882]RUV08046.1 GMC family oxidoreductase [Mesorhizobium sp. M1A.F.Ca.IN.020.03.2.1]RUV89612.1 GMC family oxidoreductase [Mesorhizobium sp. M1A.F.Ca.IN.020.32.1.1]RUW14715.1 GMC family oxidoreductase [Mesorhizobium sp. M1A.F.Ca.IN.022.05.2.1]RUW37188.1 GMC family oxidoreductase [Mesorhizobium sp. M1A.F.Ca.IN.020.06.1.1]
MDQTADIVIIGSGIGGASLAHSLAGTGRRIVILERGEHLRDAPQARDDRAIFLEGFYRSTEKWVGTDGQAFLPGNYYYVGGNSKFFGAVMYRYRLEDFSPRPHMDGASPGWPITYHELEPWYERAEAIFKVRGDPTQDPTEPPRTGPYRFPSVPDEPAIAAVRARLKEAGIHPASLPLAIDINEWLRRAKTGWDAFPNTGSGKIDAEVGPLTAALNSSNVSLVTGANVVRLETDPMGRKVTAAVFLKDGVERRISAGIFAVAAGAVQSAALLLRSANAAHPRGLANGSDQLGRNFMNHNTTAMLAIDPRSANTSVYQKTLAFNDFYNADPETGFPLGNVQLLGHITGNILKANAPLLPRWLAGLIARNCYGWFLTSEDLPNPESRVTVQNGRIVMHWVRSNMRAHELLIRRTRGVMRRAGFPIVLTRTFGRKTTSHQCGTARLGSDPETSVVSPDCRSHEIANLYVTDASVLPTSAAVNPALTIAALAIKAGAVISRS